MTVYFAQSLNDGLVKIGCSEMGNVWRRIKTVQTFYKTKVDVLGLVEGNQAIEKEIHRRLKSLLANGRGREWFKPEGELKRLLRKFKQKPIPWLDIDPTHKLDLFADGVKLIPIEGKFTRMRSTRAKYKISKQLLNYHFPGGRQNIKGKR